MKKVLLLALLVLALAFVAACGRNGDDNGDDNGGTAITDPVQNDEDDNGDDAGAPEPGPGDDDNGEVDETLPDVVWDLDNLEPFLDRHFPAVDLGGITLGFSGLGNADTDNPEYAARYAPRRAMVEERFNITMDFSHHSITDHAAWTDVPDFLIASVAAGNPVTNFFSGSAGYWYRALANHDAVVDMTEWFHENLPRHWFAYIGEHRGRAHGFNTGNYSWLFLSYNRDLVRGSGIQYTPQEMFLQGRWSWDDFHDYFMELRTLLPDEIEMIGMHLSHWKRMGTMSNGTWILHPATNIPGMLDEAYIDFANFTQRLVQDRLWRAPGFIEYGMAAGVPPEGQWSFVETWMENPMSHGAMFQYGYLVMTSRHPWNVYSDAARFENGMVPFPWGPRVSWPASGDWRDLKTANPGLYNSPTHDTSNTTLLVGTPDVVTPEVFIAIMATWRPEMARDLVIDMERQAQGLPARYATPGGMNDFWTDMDRDIYQWYASHPVWEPMDAIGFWTHQGAYNRLWQGTLWLGGDFRPVFESVVGGIILGLMDTGMINEVDVPAHLMPFVQEALEARDDD